ESEREDGGEGEGRLPAEDAQRLTHVMWPHARVLRAKRGGGFVRGPGVRGGGRRARPRYESKPRRRTTPIPRGGPGLSRAAHPQRHRGNPGGNSRAAFGTVAAKHVCGRTTAGVARAVAR